jgi:hypothetical protein
MVLWLVLESHGTLVAVLAPLVMPLHDSGIPMNVPFIFRINKQLLFLQKLAVSQMLDGRGEHHRRSSLRHFYNADSVGLVDGTGYPTRSWIVGWVLGKFGKTFLNTR